MRRRTTKTDAGERVLPLNADAWAAVLELWERAKTLGGTEPDHYVFPACENFRFDPTKPQKSWRSAWRSLRKAAGLQAFRFHDTRHQAVTELAESPASDQTIMAIAGHVSPKMLAHYSHVRMEAKRRALDALSSRPLDRPADGGLEGGYGTNHVTKAPSQPVLDSQVVEKDGAPGETRTPDLLVRSQSLYPTELRARTSQCSGVPIIKSTGGGPGREARRLISRGAPRKQPAGPAGAARRSGRLAARWVHCPPKRGSGPRRG